MTNLERNITQCMQIPDLHTKNSQPHALNNEEVGDINVFGKLKEMKNLSSKVINTIYNWNNTLKFMRTETSVIFAPLNNGNLDTIQMIDVVEKAIQLHIIGDLSAIHILPHKAFIYLNFKTAKTAAMFQNSVDNIKGKKLFYVDMEPLDRNIHITIDKIPAITLRKLLPEILDKYGKIINIRPTLIKIKGSDPIETSPVMIDFELNKHVSKGDFPHFIFINTIKVYLLVKGKPNICFICDSEDHLASDCKFKFCEKCKKLRAVNHSCVNSYASRLVSSLNKIGSLIEEGTLGYFPKLPEIISQNEESESSTSISKDLENINILKCHQNEVEEENCNLSNKNNLSGTDVQLVDQNNMEIVEENIDKEQDISVTLKIDKNSITGKAVKQKLEELVLPSQDGIRTKHTRNKNKSKNAKKFKVDSESVNKSYLLRSDLKGMIGSANTQAMEFRDDDKSASDSNSSCIEDDDNPLT